MIGELTSPLNLKRGLICTLLAFVSARDSFVMVVPCAVVYCIGGRIWDISVVRLLNLDDGEPKAQRACQTSAVERSHGVLLVMRSRISVMWARERLKQIQAFCNLEVRSDCMPAPC